MTTRAFGTIALRTLLAGAGHALLIGTVHAQSGGSPLHLDGDIGLGAYAKRSIVRGASDATSVLPYLDFDYGPAFARVDTFGLKTLPLGYGHLELVGRVTQDGFSTDTPALKGLRARDTSIPLGAGTLQVTPIGGFWVNAFHDVRRSKGNLFELIYGGELKVFGVTLNPLLGAEYQSSNYVRYYYGVSPSEAASSAYPMYGPAGGARNALAGLLFDIPLADGYHLNGHLRRKWLGDAIALSPIVGRRVQDSAYLALSYHFK